MQTDEQQIRQLISDWMAATKAKDVEEVMSLISKQQASENAPDIDGKSEIQEIKVIGEWAFVWAKLHVTITPPKGSAAITRAGHTLSVLKKENGKWLLTRDANLLSSVPQPTPQ